MTPPMTHHSDPAREAVARREEQLRIQALGAALSRREWWEVEQAYNRIRDEFDRRPASPAPAAGGLEAVLDHERIPSWPPLKHALWMVVTGEKLNDGHYINAYQLTDKLYAAALASPAATSAETQGGDGVREAVEDIGFVSAFLRIAAQRQDVPASVRRQIMKAVDVIAALAPSTSAATRGEPWTVESLAQWFHDEAEHQESYPHHHWPEHPDDDGNRDGGFVKIVPQHAQAYFRQLAARCLGIRPFTGRYFEAIGANPPAPGAQVKVKPLEWRARTSLHHYAETPFGSYSAFVDGGWEGPSSSGNAGGSFPEGRAAAEAQHQHDIRASLDLATDAEG